MMFPTVVTILTFSILPNQGYGRCLLDIQAPCSCTTTRYEPVSIVCDAADSLEDVLKALAQPPPFIDSLTISNTAIPELPGQIFQGLAVKKLVLRNNGLRQIANNAFDGVMTDFMQEIEIRSNKLNEIPLHGISQLRSLHSLVLTDNEIHSIPNNIFLNYHSRLSLKKLDLSANNISHISAEGFLGLENLQQLSLDKNHFTEIPTEAIELLPTLEDLSLGVNAIQEVRNNSLPLPKLKSLSLEVNEIKTIEADAFKQTPHLLYLYLSNNKFTKIDPSTFYYINNLKVLAMSSNRISRIRRDDLQYVPSLVRLELVDCYINNIEDGALQRISKIQVIILARNQLTRIYQSTFASLYQLVSLDLRDNQINKIDDFGFSRLTSLRQLDLSGNKLDSLQKNTFYETFQNASSNELRYIFIFGNPWHCDLKLEWLQKWMEQNANIQFAAAGTTAALCSTPESQKNVQLTRANLQSPKSSDESTDREIPLTNSASVASSKRLPYTLLNQRMTPTTRAPIKTIERNADLPRQMQFSAFSPLVIIIVIIGLIFMIAIAIILTVQYAVKRSDEKGRDDRRDLSGSLVSGFGSTFGTGPYAGNTFYRTSKSTLHPHTQFVSRPNPRDATGINNTVDWWSYNNIR